jgi:thioesterase domain-containing protein
MTETNAPRAGSRVPAFHGVQYVLHRLWCDLLGREDIALDDDFFAVGGTDPMARELCRRVTQNFGCDVPVEVFRSAPTLGAMSVMVRTSGAGAQDGPLLRLQGGSKLDRGGIYCFHPISGSPVRYSALVDFVDRVQPVFGVQAAGLMAGHDPDKSVEAMADRYSRWIVRREPNRSLVLLGYSFGGAIAVETARCLADSGLDGIVGIVDSCPDETLDVEPSFGYESLARTIFRLDLDVADLMALNERDRLVSIRAAASRAGKLPPAFGLDRLQRIVDVCNANLAAAAAYRPERLHGRATVFESDDGRALACGARWARYIDDVTVRSLAGDHETVVEGESLAAIARWAEAALASGGRAA